MSVSPIIGSLQQHQFAALSYSVLDPTTTSSPFYLLAFPLLKYLGSKPVLDEVGRVCLSEVKRRVEESLSAYATNNTSPTSSNRQPTSSPVVNAPSPPLLSSALKAAQYSTPELLKKPQSAKVVSNDRNANCCSPDRECTSEGSNSSSTSQYGEAKAKCSVYDKKKIVPSTTEALIDSKVVEELKTASKLVAGSVGRSSSSTSAAEETRPVAAALAAGTAYRGKDESQIRAGNKSKGEGKGSGNLAGQQQQHKETVAMTAMTSYMGFSLEERRRTLMERIFGQRVSTWCTRWEHILFRVAGVLLFVTLLLLFASNLPQIFSAYTIFMINVIIGFLLGFLFFFLTYYMNWRIFQLVLLSFDSVHLIVEMVLAGISLAFVDCLPPQEILLSLFGVAFMICAYGFIDTFTIAAKTKLKYLLFSFWVGLFGVALFYYSRTIPDLCYCYQFSISEGLIENCTTDASEHGWSVSLFDFFINRAISVLIITAQITFNAFKYPNECSVINSRLRRIEE